MTGFNRWTAACETSFGWDTGSITTAQYRNAVEGARRILQENRLGLGIQEIMVKLIKSGQTRLEVMPRVLADRLKVQFTLSDLAVIMSPLRLLGYQVTFGDWQDISQRTIIVTYIPRGIPAPQNTPRIT